MFLLFSISVVSLLIIYYLDHSFFLKFKNEYYNDLIFIILSVTLIPTIFIAFEYLFYKIFLHLANMDYRKVQAIEKQQLNKLIP